MEKAGLLWGGIRLFLAGTVKKRGKVGIIMKSDQRRSDGVKRIVIALIGVMMASSAMAITVKRPDASIEIYSRSPSQGITVSQNGNVGIGTKNSSAQLAVSGDAVFTGTVNALVFSGNGAGLTNLLANTANYVAWGNVGSKPTTVAGYGITDIATQVVNTANYALNAGLLGGKTEATLAVSTADYATNAANSALLGNKAEAALNVATAVTANVALSLISSTVTKTGNYVMTGAEAYIVANPAAGAITITLPDPAVVPGKSFTVKKIDNAGYDVVISAGSNTIDGTGIYVLTAKGEFVTLLSTGATDWVIAGNN